jgi:nicotinate phosphoribosyltransferase
MKETGIYFEDYLNFLSQINLKKIFAHEIIVDNKPQFQLTYSGLWSETIMFETYCLSIIAELYSRVVACKKYSINNKLSKEEFSNLFVLAMSGDEDILQKINTPYYQEAMKRLDDKILILKNHPEIKFFDFSTRRRFSQELQENILLKLSSEFHRPQFIGISQFLGTSNEYIGFKHSMKVGGTYAHEMPQVITALSEPDETNMLNAQYEFMRKWNKFYGYDLSVGLTDTFGSDSFFKNCPEDIANMYSFREDSSTNIYKYTNDVLDLYKKFNINHNEKVIVHSNGLDIGKVLDINSFSQNKINKVYGIDTVKLSDNIAKAIGKKEKIKLYKKVFGYQISTFVEQIY